MEIPALSLLAILLAGCAQIVPEASPVPPGMPLDPEHLPDADGRAITKADARIPPSI